MYKYISKDQTTIFRESDGAFIPVAESNRDYQEVLQWISEGNTITPWKEFNTAEEALIGMKKKIKDKRTEIEQGGITYGGSIIDTSVESQNRISGAKIYLDMNPTLEIDWKGPNGWTKIGKDIVTGIAAIVGTHVQACFTAEKNHCIELEKLTEYDDIIAYDYSINWPSTEY